MSITLKWSKKDSDAVLDKYEIYRGIDKATLYQAGNLLTTILDKNQIQYTDASALIDVAYWYGIRSKTIYGDVDSTPVLQIDVTNPGFGNVAPTVGDYDDGLVETYYNDNAFTQAASKTIYAQFWKFYVDGTNTDTSLGPTTFTGNPNPSYCVNKFWKNGKIIFAPNHPLMMVKGMTVLQAMTNIINPLITAKPVVEIEGAMYEFGIMTRDEVLKYIACGQVTSIAYNTNHHTDRVVPKTYKDIGTGSTWIFRSLHAESGDGKPCVNGTPATGVVTYNANADNLASGAGIPWYFTPVKV